MHKTSHEIDFEIMGSDMQIVEITLDPQEDRHLRSRRLQLHG